MLETAAAGLNARIMAPALLGIAHLGCAARIMMQPRGNLLGGHMMRLRCIRRLHGFAKLRVPESLLVAAVAHNFKANGRERIHAERILGACRQIDNPPCNKRPPVIDAHCDAAAGPLIANDYARPERQAFMCCRYSHVTEVFAICSARTHRVCGGDSALGKRLLAANERCCCQQNSRRDTLHSLHHNLSLSYNSDGGDETGKCGVNLKLIVE